MIWKKITIETTTLASDVVASVLFDNGIVGAQVEDNVNLTDDELKRMYVDIPIENIDDGIAKVSFYVTEVISNDNKKSANFIGVNDSVDNSYKQSTDNFFTKEELNNIIVNIKNDLLSYKDFMNMGTLNFSETYLDDNVFLNKWKENFKPILLDNINIIPDFDKDKYKNDNSKINIFIEPGNAFGTGQHDTTRLCVKLIEKIVNEKLIDLRNSKILDLGCGSGVLGIISLKLGINRLFAVDIDKDIENNLTHNFALNDITSTKYDINSVDKTVIYDFGNVLTDVGLKDKLKLFGNFDVVVANILAPVICSLLGNGKIHEYIKKDGFFICSGIIKDKEQEILDSIKKNGHFDVVSTIYSGDWVAFLTKLV